MVYGFSYFLMKTLAFPAGTYVRVMRMHTQISSLSLSLPSTARTGGYHYLAMKVIEDNLFGRQLSLKNPFAQRALNTAITCS